MTKFVLIIGLALLFSACSRSELVNEVTAIEDGAWGFNDARKLSVEAIDTLTPYNFYILIRHSGNYAYQNVILYFKTYYPNNTYKVDTIDCPLADNSGRWYGSGLGDMLDNRIMFKRNVQLPMTGSYNFEIQHAMRQDTVQGIYDIGLLIEGATK